MLEELKDEVVKILMSNYDFDIEEAQESVTESMSSDPDIWNENADAQDLAKHVATSDDDE